MNAQILVITHKPYWMPNDKIYLPLHVGKWDKPSLGITGDDTGVNISAKNANYCELTGLYWSWKNLAADYIGLTHYRRHFTVKSGLFKSPEQKKNCVLTTFELDPFLNKCDVIVPNKRKYYIETNRSHYNHAHQAKDLDITEQIILKKYPDYTQSFILVMNRTWAHMFNMFIMRREQLNHYCEWLFDILFELEKRTDLSDYSVSESRVFGYISELLLDVWLEKNNISYREMNVMFMEKQNWLIKGGNFLKRKFWRNRG